MNFTCLDCEYKQNNPDGGFCYMFAEHFKRNESAGPLTPCAKFIKGEKLNGKT